MLTLATALQLLELAKGATPVLTAIYESANRLLPETDQAELKSVYDAEFARAVANHDELQRESVRD